MAKKETKIWAVSDEKKESCSPTHPGGDREEWEGHSGACRVHRDTSDVLSVTPQTSQQAETHKPQEGPHPYKTYRDTDAQTKHTDLNDCFHCIETASKVLSWNPWYEEPSL